MYGGSTNHFTYVSRPLDAADPNPRPGYRDASWPFDIAELDRYYPDANDTGRLGPFNYDDIDFWADAKFVPIPFHPCRAIRSKTRFSTPNPITGSTIFKSSLGRP